MTDSIRQQIIDKVDARLKTITTLNGYKTNIGNHVFDWLDRDLANSELDALVYRDSLNEIESSTIHQYTNKLRLEIEVKTRQGSTTAKQVRYMIEDVYKAIAVDDRWDGLAIDTQAESEIMDLEQYDRVTGSAIVVILIEYETDKWSF